MCVKDGAQYINEQIESIINQDFSNWELTIVDDGSVDNSFEIAEKFSKLDQRIKILKNKKNMGILKSFIFNAKKLNGEWVIFCDQDDVWFKNKLSTLNRFIKSKCDYDLFLHNGVYLVDQNKKRMRGAFGNFINNNQKVYPKNPNFSFLSLFISNKIIGCFCCVKIEFLRKNLISLPLANLYHDHWIAIIVSLYSRIYFIDEDLIKYRRHSQNNTLRNRLLKKLLDRVLLIFSIFLNHLSIIFKKLGIWNRTSSI